MKKISLYDLFFLWTLAWAIGATVCWWIAFDAFKEVVEIAAEYKCMTEELLDQIQ